MDIEEIRDYPDNELELLLDEKKEALQNLRFKLVTDVIEDSSQFKKLRKDIARIRTVMNNRDSK